MTADPSVPSLPQARRSQEQRMTRTTSESLYERAGGDLTLSLAVEGFYAKVTSDGKIGRASCRERVSIDV